MLYFLYIFSFLQERDFHIENFAAQNEILIPFKCSDSNNGVILLPAYLSTRNEWQTTVHRIQYFVLMRVVFFSLSFSFSISIYLYEFYLKNEWVNGGKPKTIPNDRTIRRMNFKRLIHLKYISKKGANLLHTVSYIDNNETKLNYLFVYINKEPSQNLALPLV